jgi:hypothetical protein
MAKVKFDKQEIYLISKEHNNKILEAKIWALPAAFSLAEWQLQILLRRRLRDKSL